MKRNGGRSTIRVSKLLVGAALADFFKPKLFQNTNDFTRLENGYIAHLCHFNLLSPNEYGFDSTVVIFKQHADYFNQV